MPAKCSKALLSLPQVRLEQLAGTLFVKQFTVKAYLLLLPMRTFLPQPDQLSPHTGLLVTLYAFALQAQPRVRVAAQTNGLRRRVWLAEWHASRSPNLWPS